MFEAKTLRIWFGATLLLSAISCGEGLSAQEKQPSITDAYHIGVGDRIKVEVWQHPELTKTVVVDRKGNITFPSVNVVKASGLSAMGLASILRQKLERTITDPRVTITVGNARSALSLSPQPPSQLRDSPSPGRQQDCCVARHEGP